MGRMHPSEVLTPEHDATINIQGTPPACLGLCYNLLRASGATKAVSWQATSRIRAAPYAHPFFWTPFTLMGNWQCVRAKSRRP